MSKSDKKVEDNRDGHKKVTNNYLHGQVTSEYDEKGNQISSKIQLPSGFLIEKSDQKQVIHGKNYHSETTPIADEKQVYEELIGKWKNVYMTKNGKKDGMFKSYHPNGCLFEEGTYKNGVRDGAFKAYDEQGHLLNKSFYENGQKVRSELYSLDGKRPRVTLYDSDGNPQKSSK